MVVSLAHISITARNALELARFYKSALGCTERRSPVRLTGEKVSRGNGLEDSDITSIWLDFGKTTGPFLEIMEFKQSCPRDVPKVNEPGFGHIALNTDDLALQVKKVLDSGGLMQGQITNFGSDEAKILVVYLRDPEGNLLEFEQKPS